MIFTVGWGCNLIFNRMWTEASKKCPGPQMCDACRDSCPINTRGIGYRPLTEASRELTGLLEKPWAVVGEETGTTHGSPGQSTFSPQGLASLDTLAGSASLGAGLSVGIWGERTHVPLRVSQTLRLPFSQSVKWA